MATSGQTANSKTSYLKLSGNLRTIDITFIVIGVVDEKAPFEQFTEYCNKREFINIHHSAYEDKRFGQSALYSAYM